MKKPKIIETRPILLSQLEAAPTNANHMTDEQEASLEKAIAEVGFLQPLLVVKLGPNRYRIIDGHHRAACAGRLGYAELPSVVVETEADAEAILAIGMNRLRGELNLGEVAKVFVELDSLGWTLPELELTGFSTDEIEDFLKAARVTSEEEVMAGGSLGSTEDAPLEEADGPFELTLGFASKAELQQARKGLRRAAGKGRELGEGLLSLLEE